MSDSTYDYERHSRLAGPLTEPPVVGRYSVQFRRLEGSRPIRSGLLVLAALLFVGGFLVWLMLPEHWPHGGDDMLVNVASIVMTVTTGVIGWFAFINVATLCRATLLARDPVPVKLPAGQRVAFLTTIVPRPSRSTWSGRRSRRRCAIRHPGQLDVWLLDEGDDPDGQGALRASSACTTSPARACATWNRPKGPHRRRTKHGNYNAWLDAHGDDYDFFASVDTDHVPLPNFLERMLGYFRDPDVGLRRRPAGLRQLRQPRHQGRRVAAVPLPRADPARRQPLRRADVRRHQQRRTDQRAAADRRPVRLDHRGHGHRLRAPPATATRRPAGSWRSVYTPGRARGRRGPALLDRLLHPAACAGRAAPYETLLKQYWKGWPSLPPGKLFNYTLMIVYYPMSALNWILGGAELRRSSWARRLRA